MDFEEVFHKNFSSCYKRPGRPQQLANILQGSGESDQEYLTRWSGVRNSCEGGHEMQAVGFFITGCRKGMMLKHKLLRADPKSMGALMAIADNYATADVAMKKKVVMDPSGGITQGQGTSRPAKQEPTGPVDHASWPENHRSHRND